MMGLMFSVFINAFIIAVIPYARYQSFISCIKVSALTSAFLIPIGLVSAITQFFVDIILRFIPILGGLVSALVYMALSFIAITIALRLADNLVEDFEIKTMPETMITAMILAILNGGGFSYFH